MDDKNKQAEREHADRLFKRLPDETIEQHLDRFSAGINAAQEQAEPVANNEAYDLAYDKIDRFLRSNLDDDDYAEFSRALDSLFAAPAPIASPDTVGVILEMREQAREARQSDPDAGIFADHAYADLLDEWANRLERHDGRMSGLVRDYIEGMSVSIDVSTGEHDAGNRYYGFVSEVMDDPDDKHGVTLLVQDDVRPNFKVSASPAALTAKQRYDECMREDEEPSAVERLRFFCSLAMDGQDWLDVEPFFDDLLTAPSASAQQAIPVAEVTAGNLGNRLMWHTEDAQSLTPVGTLLYAAPAPASPADQVGWQPIETAPKDGAVIDLWVGDHRRTSCFWGLPHHCCGEMGSYCDSEWHDLVDGWVDDTNEPLSEFASPTHWMPLPPAPAMSASREGA